MELIGFFIIILVMVIVIVRRQMLKGRLDQEDFDNSAGILQLRLEDAADHIIERMEDHMDQLQLLIEEADEKITLLDGRIAALKNASEPALAERVAGQTKTAILSREQQLCPANFSGILHDGIKERKKSALKPSKLNQAVVEMLQSGHTIDEIAKQTGMGKGAILLIQGMYGTIAR